MISSELVACQQQGLGVSTKWGQVEAPIPEADLQLSWILSVNKISRSLGNPKRVTEGDVEEARTQQENSTR
ncbi:hypothetical protein N9V92_00260 [Luminiphilus sp.]|jgi:hypothetical protein|nr:hypothetical protein [Luminiphilus sp.]MDA8826083.1 hypothetical protein [Luminiphilus sp.]MDB2351604.1 hypothetical protein [Luminiphilus sp.]MDC3405718.1 hypothetical protein [Luminiphilus sp.]